MSEVEVANQCQADRVRREPALVVLVDHNGDGEASANGVAHKQAAEWLRRIADVWDPA